MILKSLAKKTAARTKLFLGAKFSERDRDIVVENAKKYTKGNVSEWIRYCATQRTPHPKDIKDERKAL